MALFAVIVAEYFAAMPTTIMPKGLPFAMAHHTPLFGICPHLCIAACWTVQLCLITSTFAKRFVCIDYVIAGGGGHRNFLIVLDRVSSTPPGGCPRSLTGGLAARPAQRCLRTETIIWIDQWSAFGQGLFPKNSWFMLICAESLMFFIHSSMRCF